MICCDRRMVDTAFVDFLTRHRSITTVISSGLRYLDMVMCNAQFTNRISDNTFSGIQVIIDDSHFQSSTQKVGLNSQILCFSTQSRTNTLTQALIYLSRKMDCQYPSLSPTTQTKPKEPQTFSIRSDPNVNYTPSNTTISNRIYPNLNTTTNKMSPPYKQVPLITLLESLRKSCINPINNQRCRRKANCTKSEAHAEEHTDLVHGLILS